MANADWRIVGTRVFQSNEPRSLCLQNLRTEAASSLLIVNFENIGVNRAPPLILSKFPLNITDVDPEAFQFLQDIYNLLFTINTSVNVQTNSPTAFCFPAED